MTTHAQSHYHPTQLSTTAAFFHPNSIVPNSTPNDSPPFSYNEPTTIYDAILQAVKYKSIHILRSFVKRFPHFLTTPSITTPLLDPYNTKQSKLKHTPISYLFYCIGTHIQNKENNFSFESISNCGNDILAVLINELKCEPCWVAFFVLFHFIPSSTYSTSPLVPIAQQPSQQPQHPSPPTFATTVTNSSSPQDYPLYTTTTDMAGYNHNIIRSDSPSSDSNQDACLNEFYTSVTLPSGHLSTPDAVVSISLLKTHSNSSNHTNIAQNNENDQSLPNSTSLPASTSPISYYPQSDMSLGNSQNDLLEFFFASLTQFTIRHTTSYSILYLLLQSYMVIIDDQLAQTFIWPKIRNEIIHHYDGRKPVKPSSKNVLSFLIHADSQDFLLDISSLAPLAPASLSVLGSHQNNNNNTKSSVFYMYSTYPLRRYILIKQYLETLQLIDKTKINANETYFALTNWEKSDSKVALEYLSDTSSTRVFTLITTLYDNLNQLSIYNKFTKRTLFQNALHEKSYQRALWLSKKAPLLYELNPGALSSIQDHDDKIDNSSNKNDLNPQQQQQSNTRRDTSKFPNLIRAGKQYTEHHLSLIKQNHLETVEEIKANMAFVSQKQRYMTIAMSQQLNINLNVGSSDNQHSPTCSNNDSSHSQLSLSSSYQIATPSFPFTSTTNGGAGLNFGLDNLRIDSQQSHLSQKRISPLSGEQHFQQQLQQHPQLQPSPTQHNIVPLLPITHPLHSQQQLSNSPLTSNALLFNPNLQPISGIDPFLSLNPSSPSISVQQGHKSSLSSANTFPQNFVSLGEFNALLAQYQKLQDQLAFTLSQNQQQRQHIQLQNLQIQEFCRETRQFSGSGTSNMSNLNNLSNNNNNMPSVTTNMSTMQNNMTTNHNNMPSISNNTNTTHNNHHHNNITNPSNFSQSQSLSRSQQDVSNRNLNLNDNLQSLGSDLSILTDLHSNNHLTNFVPSNNYMPNMNTLIGNPSNQYMGMATLGGINNANLTGIMNNFDMMNSLNIVTMNPNNNMSQMPLQTTSNNPSSHQLSTTNTNNNNVNSSTSLQHSVSNPLSQPTQSHSNGSQHHL